MERWAHAKRMKKINTSDLAQKGQCPRMQQLQNDCVNLGKVMMAILTERLRGKTEEYMADEQAGFRKDRSTVQQILALRLIGEKARRKNIKIYNGFIDFSKAFDSIDQGITWAAIESLGVDKRLTRLLKEINGNATAAIRIGAKREIGLKQVEVQDKETQYPQAPSSYYWKESWIR